MLRWIRLFSQINQCWLPFLLRLKIS